MRSDSWTVNGLTGYKFTAVQSSSGDLKADRKAGEWSASWVVTFYVCASGGSLTTLGSCTFSRSSDGSGYQTEYVSVALTAVSVTDAVQVGVKTWIGGTLYRTTNYISEQLGAGSIDAATWTVVLKTERYYVLVGSTWWTYARHYFGSSSYNSRVEGFSWSLPVSNVTLLAGVSPGGSGSLNVSAYSSWVQYGNVSVLASASEFYGLSGWLLNDSDVGVSNPYVLNMTDNFNLTAVFSLVNYTLLASVSPVGGGSLNVSGSSSYVAFSNVTVVASASLGYVFSYWLLNSSGVGNSSSYCLNMTGDFDLVAVFSVVFSGDDGGFIVACVALGLIFGFGVVVKVRRGEGGLQFFRRISIGLLRIVGQAARLA